MLELSRVDRIERTYDLPALFPDLSGPFTSASVALLPLHTGPTAATVWQSVAVAGGSATVLYAGPEADSTGAVVVTGNGDLWMKAAAGSEAEAVRAERQVRLLGGGGATAPGPLPQVLSVAGLTGAITAQSIADKLNADSTGVARERVGDATGYARRPPGSDPVRYTGPLVPSDMQTGDVWLDINGAGLGV